MISPRTRFTAAACGALGVALLVANTTVFAAICGFLMDLVNFKTTTGAVGIRKLPCQADHSKGDCAADEGLGRNVSGGTRPRLSWGRSRL